MRGKKAQKNIWYFQYVQGFRLLHVCNPLGNEPQNTAC